MWHFTFSLTSRKLTFYYVLHICFLLVHEWNRTTFKINSVIQQGLCTLTERTCKIRQMRKEIDLCVQCSLSLLSSQATISSHHDYRGFCGKMGLIPVLHQLSNLFQSVFDGFDRPSLAKWDRLRQVKQLRSAAKYWGKSLCYIKNYIH